jgi:hypothetical protein
MTKQIHRLMPSKTELRVQEFDWTEPVDGLMVALKMTQVEYIEVFVDGKLLKEDKHYVRVFEGGKAVILFEEPVPANSWAILKIYSQK